MCMEYAWNMYGTWFWVGRGSGWLAESPTNQAVWGPHTHKQTNTNSHIHTYIAICMECVWNMHGICMEHGSGLAGVLVGWLKVQPTKLFGDHAHINKKHKLTHTRICIFTYAGKCQNSFPLQRPIKKLCWQNLEKPQVPDSRV
jgi:hypothetical protein